MNKKVGGLLVFVLIVCGVVGVYYYMHGLTKNEKEYPFGITTQRGYVSFNSWEEINDYLKNTRSNAHNGYIGHTVGTQLVTEQKKSLETKASSTTTPENFDNYVKRYSTTNVQVKGIDEADIVKTNGKIIAFSPYYSWMKKTYILNAVPIDEINISKIINEGGELYLKDGKLYVLSSKNLYVYEVSTGKKLWSVEFNGTYYDSRLYEDALYVIIRSSSYEPIRFFGGLRILPSKYVVPVYSEIYNYNYPIQYIVAKINLNTYKVEDAMEFRGSYNNNIYMSKNYIYIVNKREISQPYFILKFMKKFGDEHFDDESKTKLNRILSNEDFSVESKLLEAKKMLEEYVSSLNREEKENLENEVERELEAFLEKEILEYEFSDILKINLNDFSYVSGEVPGHVLNSFSMDEYQGYFRIATTVGNWRIKEHRVNNIFILDDNLKIVGELTGIEKGERIYSVRFNGDTAYVVTYKETDPLFVFDLSDPYNPKLKGKLTLPGYSTYLHNIKGDYYIGIGKNSENKVKLSLFDISNISAPKEIDSYFTTKYWSRALYEHHAFLWDKDNNLLILPIDKELYIFKIDFDLGKLKLIKIIDFDSEVLRSIYINNYIYGFSYKTLKVIDENTGNVVKEVSFPNNPPPYVYPY